MRVADYLVERIAGLGIDYVFLVTGGGAMHLDDALGRRPDLRYVCNHHEQACAIAVEGYARIRGDIGAAIVTSGPGGTNTITGVLGMWHDSVPALFISGQVRFDTTVASTGLPLRQLGDQEADIIRLVASITKYAVMVVDPDSVRYHFEKAVWLARTGRPGPVWLDIPLSVQAAHIDPGKLRGFAPSELAHLSTKVVDGRGGGRTRIVLGAADVPDDAQPLSAWPPPCSAPQGPGALSGAFDKTLARSQIKSLVARLRAAERPVILAGSAVHAAHAQSAFLDLVETLGVPVTTAWNAPDLLWDSHPLYVGRPGTLGERAGNFAVQNADLLLVLGCRLNVRQIGYAFTGFARGAWKVTVDIDEAELAKPTVCPDLPVHADIAWFMSALTKASMPWRTELHRPGWLSWCRERRQRYPVVVPEYRRHDTPVNPYVFIDELSGQLAPDDVIVLANGGACVVTLQALRIKRGQRVVVNSGTAGMGYDLPAAIGAAFALKARRPSGSGRVICLAGDGSIQMNIQELQTIVHHQLPIKVFVFNNDGYSSIRQTQDNLCAGLRVGESSTSGVSFPDMVSLSQAYRIPATRVCCHGDLSTAIKTTLNSLGPALLDVVMDPEQPFSPKVMAEKLPDGRLVSKPLEDMYPWLDRAEFRENMLADFAQEN